MPTTLQRLVLASLCTAVIACGARSSTAPAPLLPEQPRSATPPDFRFVQMADTQFGFFSTPLLMARFEKSLTKDRFERETENFEQAVAAAAALDPAFVVMCGDLVNSWGHEGQAAEFLRIRGQLGGDVPFYVMPGNHDVGNRPTSESLAWYRETFGPDWYSFEHEGFHGIVLNSSLFTAPDKVRDEAAAQMRWLEEELARVRSAEPKHIAVFMHFPLFLESAEESGGYFTVPVDARRTLLSLFERYGVRTVFAGHYHRNAYGRAGNIEMITTGAVGRPLGDGVSGFRLVDVFSDRIEHHYRSLDEWTRRAVEVDSKVRP